MIYCIFHHILFSPLSLILLFLSSKNGNNSFIIRFSFLLYHFLYFFSLQRMGTTLLSSALLHSLPYMPLSSRNPFCQYCDIYSPSPLSHPTTLIVTISPSSKVIRRIFYIKQPYLLAITITILFTYGFIKIGLKSISLVVSVIFLPGCLSMVS